MNAMPVWPDSSTNQQCDVFFIRAALMGENVHWVVPSRAQFEDMPLAISREVQKAGARGVIRFFGAHELSNQHELKGRWQRFVNDVAP
jgi:hypothetical protein